MDSLNVILDSHNETIEAIVHKLKKENPEFAEVVKELERKYDRLSFLYDIIRNLMEDINDTTMKYMHILMQSPEYQLFIKSKEEIDRVIVYRNKSRWEVFMKHVRKLSKTSHEAGVVITTMNYKPDPSKIKPPSIKKIVEIVANNDLLYIPDNVDEESHEFKDIPSLMKFLEEFEKTIDWSEKRSVEVVVNLYNKQIGFMYSIKFTSASKSRLHPSIVIEVGQYDISYNNPIKTLNVSNDDDQLDDI